MKLNLGCGDNIRTGWVNCDIYPENENVRYLDLNKLPLPFDDNSIDEINLSQVLEHLECHPYEFVKDCFRILKKDGNITIGLPSFSFNLPHLRGYHPDSYMNAVFHKSKKNHVYAKSLGIQIGFKRKYSLFLFLRRCKELFLAMSSENIIWEFKK